MEKLNGKIKSWKDIIGWFDFSEVYDLVVDKASDSAVFVEVGSWFGRSTAYMGEQIKKNSKNIKFYVVDTWEGAGESETQKTIVSNYGGNIFPAFWQNMVNSKLEDLISPLQITSEKASLLFDDETLDFVFIDASHVYDEVTKDISCWYPKIKKGGIIAGHDFTPRFDVPDAVQDFFGTNFYLKGNSWLSEKT